MLFQTLRYTTDHQWINLKSGYSGLTIHAFENYDQLNLEYRIVSPYCLKLNQLSGVLLYEKEVNKYFWSPVTGKITQLNHSWSPINIDVEWVYQIDIEIYRDDLMSYEEYL
jgi:hypothetical protein